MTAADVTDAMTAADVTDTVAAADVTDASIENEFVTYPFSNSINFVYFNTIFRE